MSGVRGNRNPYLLRIGDIHILKGALWTRITQDCRVSVDDLGQFDLVYVRTLQIIMIVGSYIDRTYVDDLNELFAI